MLTHPHNLCRGSSLIEALMALAFISGSHLLLLQSTAWLNRHMISIEHQFHEAIEHSNAHELDMVDWLYDYR
jgi:hypothetical protein